MRKNHPERPGRSFRIFLAVFLALLTLGLQGCSRMDVLYYLSGRTLLQRLDHYFDLSDAQTDYWEQRIDTLLAWHRREELPKLTRSLEDFHRRYARGLTETDLLWFQKQSWQFWQRLLIQGADDFGQFLTTLNPQQVTRFQAKMEDSNEDRIRQAGLTEAALQEETFEWITGWLEDWLGNLDEAQRTAIRGWMPGDGPWARAKLENRRTYQQALLALAASDQPAPERTAVLKRRFEQPETFWTAPFRNQWQNKRQQWRNIYLKIDALTRPAQRAHALEKLEGYLSDLRAALQA